MRDVVQNLSTLTTISKDTLNQLIDKSMMCMFDAILESCMSNKEATELDIGIGILTILYSNNEIRYKFRPSAKFEEGVIRTIVRHDNTLDKTVDKELKERLVHTYKDLL